MQRIKTHFAQPCYHLRNDKVELYSTILAGNTVPYFTLDSGVKAPFFIPPWWNEGWLGGEYPTLFNACRGNFFCLPLGGDPTGSAGRVIPAHGRCCNENWELVEVSERDAVKTLWMDFKDEPGLIRKELRLLDGQNVVYENNRVIGWEGDYPVGYHPIIRLPETCGSAHFAMSAIVDGYSTFESHERAENGGYSLLRNAQRITDIRRLETIFGTEVDFTSQPIQRGYEDVFMTISGQSTGFAYAAVTFRDEGYVYFQLKNPRILKNTLFWVSNGGRHYPPWNGRSGPSLGIEDAVSFFHYGLPASAQKNPVNSIGHDTAVHFNRHEEYDFPLIYGVAPIPSGFMGVKGMKEKAGGVTIEGLGGEKVDVVLELEFLDRRP